jgi:hypothetical protein
LSFAIFIDYSRLAKQLASKLALDKLVYLDFSWNLKDSLTFFPANLRILSSLNVAGFQLRFLNDRVFVNLTSLTYLGLNENKLVALSDNTFKGLHNLQVLSLHSNRLVRVTQRLFNDLTSLKYLNLIKNRIMSLEDFSPSLGQLTSLDLQYNSLTVLNAECFKSLANLEYLTL